jgi:hypothetical protein
MKQTYLYLWYPLFQAQWDICDQQNHQTSETDIFNMLEFLMHNIFGMFGGRVFQQTVGISMGTNCAPLLTDTFLYSYEQDFIQGLLKKNGKKLDLLS